MKKIIDTTFTHFYTIKTRMYNHISRGFLHQASMDFKELLGEIKYLQDLAVNVAEIKITDSEMSYLKSKGVVASKGA